MSRGRLFAYVAVAACCGLFVQMAIAAELPKRYTETVPDRLGEKMTFDMVLIDGGHFTMGSPDGEPGRKPDEGPKREVTVAPFYMATTETTLRLFLAYYEETNRARTVHVEAVEGKDVDAVTGPTPVFGELTMGYEKTHPAIGGTWHNAVTFCQWLSKKTGKTYRLPTEAEWEYAARAGGTTAFAFGTDKAKAGEYAWFADNADGETHPVAAKKPNAWGLYDMAGNVREWVHDFYADKYDAAVAANPKGPATGWRDDDAPAVTEGRLHRVVEALGQPRLGHETVDHGVDRVLLLLVEPDLVLEGEGRCRSTRTRANPALRTCSRTSRCSPFLSFTSGARSRKLVALGEVRDLVDESAATTVAETARPQLWRGGGRTGPQHPQVVVYLRDGPHGRARVAVSRPSARWRWWARGRGSSRRAACPSGRGTVGHRRSGSRWLPALSLGIERVEGEARLPRSRDAGDDHQLLLRDLDRDVLEVVLARPGDDDAVQLHGSSFRLRPVAGPNNHISPGAEARRGPYPGGSRVHRPRPGRGGVSGSASSGFHGQARPCRGRSRGRARARPWPAVGN